MSSLDDEATVHDIVSIPVATSSIVRRSTSPKSRSSMRFSRCGVCSTCYSHHGGHCTVPRYHVVPRVGAASPD